MKKSSGNKRRLNKKAPSLLALEPRLMFDGAVALTVDQTPTQPEPTVQEARLDEPAVKTASYTQPKDESESSTAEPATLEDDATTTPESSGAEDTNLDIDDEAIVDESAGKRLVLISGYLPEVDQIASDLSKNATVHILRADGNIVDEISEILATYQSVDELHVVSHGQPGALVFGTEVLDAEALNNQSKQVSGWGSQLAPDADILLYGCDVASEPSGIVFLKTLQGLTGADIAASDDSTGAQSLGGDAELEVEYGDIESSTALTSELLNRLDLVLDSTAPHIDTVEVNITDTTLLVTLNMSESIAADQALEDSELYVNVAGIDRYASYVPEDASDPLASNPIDASNARLVYQLDNVTQADLSLGLRMGQIVFDENSGEVVDSNNNALVPINVSDLVTEVHVDDGETLVFGGGFAGSGDFVKTGAGELILTGANTHAGKTIVQGGTLTISSDDQLGSTTTGADRVVVQAGATLAITESVTLTTGRGITLGDGAAIAVAAGETVTYKGVIQGVDGTAIKEGEGELKLTGANNFAEGLKIDAGRLTLTNASGIDSSAGVEISANGTLDMTGNHETIGSLSGAGRVELGSRYLTIDTSGTSEFSGVIEGTGRLITTGTGVLILSGQNQYTGNTEIKEGSTLRLGADHALNNESLVY
ncbi:MAG: DUF4347 domain-containing protein, partial [Orrella sp.]